MSVPGIGYIGATTLLAEVGDIRDIPSPNKLAKWAGITPRVYQSVDKLHTGSITKQGPKHLRWVLIESAHACVRSKNSKIRTFFDRIFARFGYKKDIVVVARKILKLFWHLLSNDELYENDAPLAHKHSRLPSPKVSTSFTLSEAIELIVKAGFYVVNSDNSLNKRDLGT